MLALRCAIWCLACYTQLKLILVLYSTISLTYKHRWRHRSRRHLLVPTLLHLKVILVFLKLWVKAGIIFSLISLNLVLICFVFVLDVVWVLGGLLMLVSRYFSVGLFFLLFSFQLCFFSISHQIQVCCSSWCTILIIFAFVEVQVKITLYRHIWIMP